jgi:hypothetical protein
MQLVELALTMSVLALLFWEDLNCSYSPRRTFVSPNHFMAEPERDTNVIETDVGKSRVAPKKPYQKPAFRHEKIFETMALSCGKVQPTNFQCRFHRNAS